MTLSKNDYLKKGDTYLRVIEVLGEIMFLSWPFQEYDDCMGNGVLRREVVDSLCKGCGAELDWNPDNYPHQQVDNE